MNVALLLVFIAACWLALSQSNFLTWFSEVEDRAPWVGAPLQSAALESLPRIGSAIREFDVEARKIRAAAQSAVSMEGGGQEGVKWQQSKPEHRYRQAARMLLSGQLKVKHIAHSAELNPREVPLSDAQWDALASVIDPYVAHVCQVSSFRSENVAKEMTLLQEAGELRSVIPKQELEAAALRKAQQIAREAAADLKRSGKSGKLSVDEILKRMISGGLKPTAVGYIKRTQGGQEYYFLKSRSKMYTDCRNYEVFRSQELAWVILEWCFANQLLTRAEMNTIVDQVVDLISIYHQGG